MTIQDECEKLHNELYAFIRRTLESEFVLTGDVRLDAILSDHLGLEPSDWYKLAEMIEHEYDITFGEGGPVLFDHDRPTVRECVQMTIIQLSSQLPLDEGVYGSISSYIEDITGTDKSEITPSKRLAADLKIDWFSRLEIATMCHSAFNVAISDAELANFVTIRELVMYISLQRSIHVAV